MVFGAYGCDAGAPEPETTERSGLVTPPQPETTQPQAEPGADQENEAAGEYRTNEEEGVSEGAQNHEQKEGSPAGESPTQNTSTEASNNERRTVPVAMDEFTYHMPAVMPAGPVTFKIENDGQLKHNIRIQGQGIDETFEEDIDPGDTKTMDLTLKPGTYDITCPVGNHTERGMKMELEVTEE